MPASCLRCYGWFPVGEPFCGHFSTILYFCGKKAADHRCHAAALMLRRAAALGSIADWAVFPSASVKSSVRGCPPLFWESVLSSAMSISRKRQTVISPAAGIVTCESVPLQTMRCKS